MSSTCARDRLSGRAADEQFRWEGGGAMGIGKGREGVRYMDEEHL